ncbi:MAG TPA: hypothetical protein VIM33_07540 [Gaiellaceae bacterium]
MNSDKLPARACRGTRKDGGTCQSQFVGEDGYCGVHSPSKRFDPVETGRIAGKKSGEVRRAQSTSARERLRRIADEDKDFWKVLQQTYKDGLEATNPDGSPDFRTRVMTAGAFLAEAYGRPPQAIIGDADQPLTFILQSAFQRDEEAA